MERAKSQEGQGGPGSGGSEERGGAGMRLGGMMTQARRELGGAEEGSPPHTGRDGREGAGRDGRTPRETPERRPCMREDRPGSAARGDSTSRFTRRESRLCAVFCFPSFALYLLPKFHTFSSRQNSTNHPPNKRQTKISLRHGRLVILGWDQK